MEALPITWPEVPIAEGVRKGDIRVHSTRIFVAELPPRLIETLSRPLRLERELGRGGMATVYLARTSSTTSGGGKGPRPELAASLGHERFLREIEVAARLQHPHILALHDSGEADGFYYVMPYVEGETLRARLARARRASAAEAVRISREVADALAYAHAHGSSTAISSPRT